MKKNPGERVLLKRVIGENNDLFSSDKLYQREKVKSMEKKKLSQEDVIARHLEKHGSITSMEAFETYRITRLSGRIFDLRARGMDIVTDMVYGKGGIKYAVYRVAK